jgi:hypothetical protein
MILLEKGYAHLFAEVIESFIRAWLQQDLLFYCNIFFGVQSIYYFGVL